MPAANMSSTRIHCAQAPNGSIERGSGENPPVAMAVKEWHDRVVEVACRAPGPRSRRSSGSTMPIAVMPM